jgi:Site-specific recombinases, DNA invertase Pin homologs
MKDRNGQSPQADDQKSKIRERYKGVDESSLDVIPAIPREDFYHGTTEKRVAVYARVSTDDPRQTSSYELQKNHYTDLVSRRPDWNLTDIYADEGISGTSLQHRDEFLRMINDCNDGKVDLIVTKSVSRFARNIIDCIGYIRKLKSMKPPIGVFFETENIYTLDPNSEMSLSFIATLAQEESHTKSEIMNASIEMRFKRGIFLTPALLGYDQDDEGNLVINEEEAKTVRFIFFLYLYGYTSQQIADLLTKLGRQTKRGNTTWSAGSIMQILQNERHCGDVLARKTWTPNYLDHRSKKNNKDRNQYRMKNHHESIISRDDFIMVQRLIANAKYGNTSILPELHVRN